MPINVKCRCCNKVYQVRATLAGKSVVCKSCGEPMQVPATGNEAQADSNAAVAAGYTIQVAGEEEPVAARGQKPPTEPEGRVLRRDIASSARPARNKVSVNSQMILTAGGAIAAVAIVVAIVASVSPTPELQNPAEKNSPSPTISSLPGQPLTKSSSRRRPISGPSSLRSGPRAAEETVAHAPAVREDTPADELSNDVPAKSQLEVVLDFDAWQVEVDPPAQPERIDFRKRIYALIPKNSTGEVVYPDCPSPYVALGSNGSPREIREVRDIQANRRLGSVRASVIVNACVALSPDGLYFAAWPRGQSAIGVWDIKAERPHGLVPTGRNDAPRFLMFAGPERLIAAGDADELLVWTMPTGRPEGTIPIPKPGRSLIAGLTPGGHFLAVAADDEKRQYIAVLNLTTGKTAGEINFEGRGARQLVCRGIAFSPDGKELAALFDLPEGSNLFVFRVSDGRLTGRIKIESAIRTSNASGKPGRVLEWFPNRKRWLVNRRVVIDRDTGEIDWTAPDDEGDNSSRRVLDDNRILVRGSEKNDPALVPLSLPVRDAE